MDARDKQIARSVAYKGVIDLICAGKLTIPLEKTAFESTVNHLVNMHAQIVMDEYGQTTPGMGETQAE